MTYAGFWKRFWALCLDTLVMSPLMFVVYWGHAHSRLFDVYHLVPNTIFLFIYHVHLVQKFGGTPGKRLTNLRIVRVNGDPLSYREALLRYTPDWLAVTASAIALIIATSNLTDAQYFAAASLTERSQLLNSVMPDWNTPLRYVLSLWTLAEVVVMLANRKRRTLHDFIAGTVVIYDPPPVPEVAPPPAPTLYAKAPLA